ncbi:lipid A deacylase LpxR family protein [Yersinia enterocolitica]|uniref:lipid A deacylase LpxR family protein n=1 Tax=Yersinia enterocolitica TaxID=630 RepID=UPI0030D4A237|nr:DUF2219 family protein [Yersinia enterocolitica]
MHKNIYYGAVLSAIIASPITKADSISLSLSNDDAGIFQPTLDKLYSHADGDRDDYSQGLFLGYSRDITDTSQLSVHIAQDIYSPSGVNKRPPTAVIGDRAFSAYLHTGIEWNSLANDWFRYRLGTDFGVIGPDAGGQKVQNKAHQFINAEKYQAWDDQIENRYGYTVKGMLSLTPNIDFWGTNIGVYPELSAVSGNLFQYIGYGATFALGNDKTFNSDNGFGLLDRRGLMHTTQKDGLIYKFFAGVERREVDRNYTLQGKTLLTNTETITMNKTVDEYRVGATMGYYPVALTLSLNKVSSEFKTGKDYSYITGAVTLAF